MDNGYIRTNSFQGVNQGSKKNELSFEGRICPMCGLKTIKGMRGSPDSICKNCGYKDPCCYD